MGKRGGVNGGGGEENYVHIALKRRKTSREAKVDVLRASIEFSRVSSPGEKEEEEEEEEKEEEEEEEEGP